MTSFAEHTLSTLQQSPILPPTSRRLKRCLNSLSTVDSCFLASLSTGERQEAGKSYLPGWMAASFNDFHLGPSSQEDEQFSSSASGVNAMPTPMLPSRSRNRDSRVEWQPIESPQYSYTPQLASQILPNSSTGFLNESQPEVGYRSEVHLAAQVSEDESEPSFVKIFHEALEVDSRSATSSLKVEELYQHVKHEFSPSCKYKHSRDENMRLTSFILQCE